MISSTQTKSTFISLLGLKALLLFFIILYAGIGLGPDEAQYWTWSRALDWGYYSKPPGIAWQIWLGTSLFGQTEWGIRSLSLVLSFFQALMVYHVALRANLRPQTAFWSGILMAFCPLGLLGSFFAITDGGLLLCWTGACLVVVSALQQKKEPNPFYVAMWIGIGALFKWPIFLFWLFFLLCRHWYFSEQKISRSLLAIAVSLMGLLPSLWWNISHDWATFRHVSSTVQGGHAHVKGNLGEFLGSQSILISPILFILLLMALWQWWRERKQLSPALYFCGFITFSLLGMMSLLACFQKIQGNWLIYAYPTGLIFLGYHVFEQHINHIKWMKIGIGLSLLMTIGVLVLSSFYSYPEWSVLTPPYHLNPLKHNLGWPALGQELKERGYQPDQHFLFGDKYQTVSLLSFYGEQQKRAYFLNLRGARNNQFTYWPSLQDEQKGKTGYFVWVENMPYLKKDWQAAFDFYQGELPRFFEEVEFLGLVPLVYQDAKLVKGAFIFRCHHCLDVQKEKSTLY